MNGPSLRRTTYFVLAGAAGILAAKVFAGPEQISFPQGYQKWQLYATVDRYDSKQYREL